MTRNIVIDLFDGAEELDVIGPWEVLAHWTQKHPDDGWRVRLVSDDGEPRRCAKGLLVAPTCARDEVPEPDVVVEPGGRGSRVRLTQEEHLRWLRTAASGGALMTSVCTGALVFAAAGLLREQPATTYHAAFGELLALDSTIEPHRDRRWVDAGAVITAAGVSAGIDVALHLVGRLAGPERARQVQDGIEYHPAPPVWDAPAPSATGETDSARWRSSKPVTSPSNAPGRHWT